MTGIYGSTAEDRSREQQLDSYLADQFNGSEQQLEEQLEELEAIITVTGKVRVAAAQIDAIVMEAVCDDFGAFPCGESELAAIFRKSLTDEAEAGRRLAEHYRGHLKKFADKNPDAVSLAVAGQV